MNRLLIFILLIFASCDIISVGESEMITGNSILVQPIKRDDLVLNVLENRQYPQMPALSGGYDGVLEKYAELISDGYEIYDIPAEGGLTYLSGKSAGKYLCVWKSLEPAYLDTPETGTVGFVESGTAQAGGVNSIQLAATASSVDDFYNGMTIILTGGTGSGQTKTITDYTVVAPPKVATVDSNWSTIPDATTTYTIISTAPTATTIPLAATASSVDDYYNGMVVELTGGTGSGQFNIIKDYDGTTKVATVTTWSTIPDATTTYKIGGYDNITDPETTPHTDVIIMGVKIQEYGNIEKFNLELKVYMLGIFNEKLSVYYTDIQFIDTTGTTEIDGINISNCNIKTISHNIVFYDCDIINCNGYTMGANGKFSFVFDTTSGFYNNTMTGENESNNWLNLQTVNGFTIYNCVFKNYIGTGGFVQIYTSGGVKSAEFSNSYIINCNLKLNDILISTQSNIYWLNSQIIDGNIETALFQTTNENESNFYIGVQALDYDKINFDNMKTLEASIDRSDIVDTRLYSTVETKTYYNITFNKNWKVDDSLKKFSKDYLWVVQRDDIELNLTPAAGAKKILNFALYDNDGVTPYEYDNDENFLLKCTDGTNIVTFAYIDNRLQPTVFCDIWGNVTYTILNVYHIWQIVDNKNIKQVFTNRPIHDNTVSNSMVTGILSLNNWDNEINIGNIPK